MQSKMYMACYSSGDYDDFYTVQVFVTYNEKVAKTWVDKFNTKVEKWKKYMKRFTDKEGIYLDRKYWGTWLAGRYGKHRRIMDINEAFIEEIEIR